MFPARNRTKKVASWIKHSKHHAWYRPVPSWNNCQTANVRMSIVCKGTERKSTGTKEMAPRSDCMMNEGRSGEKLYVCLYPPWKNPGDFRCRFLVTWFSRQNSQIFPAASCSCYPYPRHAYDFSPILT
jgi:hypothetical protein